MILVQMVSFKRIFIIWLVLLGDTEDQSNDFTIYKAFYFIQIEQMVDKPTEEENITK